MLKLKPITLSQANEFVGDNHRHHGKVVGHKFSIGVIDGDKLVGVAICGRPVARHCDDGWTSEVTRLCTDGTKNACSMLYSACARAAKAMGYTRIQTYILESESGCSLEASGWSKDKETVGASWNVPSRPRIDKHPTVNKHRYCKAL